MSDVQEELIALRRTVDVLKRRVEELQSDSGGGLFASMAELEAVVEARTESLLRSKREVQELVRQRTEELQRKNEELERANVLLQEMDRMKDSLLQNVSHELKTPLVSIRGYAELLRNRYGDNLDDTQKEFLDIIVRNADHLNRVIEGLVQASQSVRGLSPFERQVFSFGALLEDVLKEIRPSAEKAQVEVHAESCDPDEVHISGDQHQIRQMLLNLIGNAIKFTTGCDRREVSVRLSRRGDRVTLVVADTGIGIPEDKLPRIFERFYQVDPSATRRYGGMGIGLSLVKEVVENHEGSLNVQSRAGEGATFTVEIPAATDESQVRGLEIASSARATGQTIAYVLEPQPETAAFFQTVLSDLGFAVAPIAALEDLWSTSVQQGSLLVLDAHALADASDAVLARLRKLADEAAPGDAPLRILLTTTQEPSGAHRRQLLTVVDQILCKPFALDEFQGAIKQLFPDLPGDRGAA
ncbi:MAG: hybrid sensor histidine kinase/response regulator [Candidatus Dadabacteria bacterium]|nr:MAG: hybrid sensor histidine kinase/response regulator [Candidatus Dadabacteria bacterium]